MSGEALLANSGATLMRSTDRGRSWQSVRGDAGAITSVYPSADNRAFVYGIAEQALYAPADVGATWRVVGSLKLSTGPYVGIASLRPVGAQPGVIYASAMALETTLFGNSVPRPRAIARSDDGGLTWSVSEGGITGQYPEAFPAPSDTAAGYAGRTDGGFVDGHSRRSSAPARQTVPPGR